MRISRGSSRAAEGGAASSTGSAVDSKLDHAKSSGPGPSGSSTRSQPEQARTRNTTNAGRTIGLPICMDPASCLAVVWARKSPPSEGAAWAACLTPCAWSCTWRLRPRAPCTAARTRGGAYAAHRHEPLVMHPLAGHRDQPAVLFDPPKRTEAGGALCEGSWLGERREGDHGRHVVLRECSDAAIVLRRCFATERVRDRERADSHSPRYVLGPPRPAIRTRGRRARCACAVARRRQAPRHLPRIRRAPFETFARRCSFRHRRRHCSPRCRRRHNHHRRSHSR